MSIQEIVRGFWHGKPLNPYQRLAMRSFHDRGYRIEIFTYDLSVDIPAWIKRRDANEIWPTDRVMQYPAGPGKGSYSLHSNLFRYTMLHQLGGWWVDLDTILIAPELPQTDLYFCPGDHRKDCQRRPQISRRTYRHGRGGWHMPWAWRECPALGPDRADFD
jgi:hypothetical protein